MKLKLFTIIFIFISFSYGSTENFILNTSGLLDQRASEKINTIGNETKAKVGVNIYLDIKGDNGINLELPIKERIVMMEGKEATLISSIQKDLNTTHSFVILTLALDQKYANILYSDDLKNAIDKDAILDGYVIPLLAAQDKNTLNAKVSAAALNGYAEIADSLAQSKGIQLVSSIGSEGKVTSSIWRVFMYTLVVIGIVLYVIIILKEKKIKKESKENTKKEENGEKIHE
ncbi:MAG: hypothetical protein RBT59_10155 [Arcobacteraceae bacterium]|nr:hypothetical protein [Arcobacteraceae bacterium]